MVKKKKPITSSSVTGFDRELVDARVQDNFAAVETNADTQVVSRNVAQTLNEKTSAENLDVDELGSEDKNDRVPIFKDPCFVHSNKSGQSSKKTRVWKNLKQIIAAERSLCLKPTDVIYSAIDAPPSFFPAKKYSDISGLPAKYTDPQTKIRYSSSEEFSRIRMLPADLVAGYLSIRKANTPVP